ncbi:MAG: DUF1697 domain-containing protein [Planctomycetota bacterium]
MKANEHLNSRKSNTKISFLRGINVGGKNKLAMADLRNALAVLDLGQLKTYIQSGNLVYASSRTTDQLDREIPRIIKKEFGIGSPCITISLNDWKQIITNLPFEDLDPKLFHVTLFPRSLKPAEKKAILPDDTVDDRLQFKKNVAYLYCPNGYSKTKLTNGFFEKKLGIQATTRNWNTVNKLLKLANELHP